MNYVPGPKNERTSHSEFALRILGTVLVAGLIGAWGYAVTRASADELRDVEVTIEKVAREGVSRERRIETQLDTIKTDVHRIEVEQSAFRAQVREALRIPRED